MSGEVYRRNHRNIEHYPHMYHAHYSSKVRIVSSPRKHRGVNRTKKSRLNLIKPKMYIKIPKKHPRSNKNLTYLIIKYRTMFV